MWSNRNEPRFRLWQSKACKWCKTRYYRWDDLRRSIEETESLELYQQWQREKASWERMENSLDQFK